MGCVDDALTMRHSLVGGSDAICAVGTLRAQQSRAVSKFASDSIIPLDNSSHRVGRHYWLPCHASAFPALPFTSRCPPHARFVSAQVVPGRGRAAHAAWRMKGGHLSTRAPTPSLSGLLAHVSSKDSHVAAY